MLSRSRITQFFIVFIFCCFNLRRSSAQSIPDNIKIPDTIFYSLNADKGVIEIDYESAWQRDVDWHEFTQPRAMMWSQLIHLPGRNVIIIYDRKKNITQVFNSNLPLSYWNAIINVKKRNWSTKSRNEENFLIKHYNSHPYLGNKRVRTHLNNGCYLVDMVNPDSLNSINILDGKHLGLIDSAGNLIFPIVYDYIELVGSDYLVKKDGLVGIINRQSQIVVPLIYEAASVKIDGSVIFESKGKVKKVYKSQSGEQRTLDDYDWIDENRLDEQVSSRPSDLIMVWKNGKYGFVNRNFKVTIPVIYDFAGYANPEGLIRVCLNKKWGFLNQMGKMIIPFEYDDAIEFYEGKSIVKKSGNSFCIDKLGGQTTGCIERYAEWKITEGGGYNQYIKGRRIVSRDYQKGVIDDFGRLVCPIIYNHIIGLESNVSEYRWSKLFYKAAIGKRWGILDKDGEVMVPFVYDEISDFKGGMEFYTVKRNNRYGLIDSRFKEVLPCEYEGIDFVTCKGQYWFLEKGKWGLMNKDLSVLIEPQYDSHGWMYNGKINVQIKERYGMIDSTGRIIIPVKYESLGDRFNNGLLEACLNKKWGYLDSLGRIFIPFEYDDVRKFYKAIAGVKKGKKYYFINNKNEAVNNVLYDFIDHEWDWHGLIKVVNKGKVGLVNDSGKEVVPCEYDGLTGYSIDKGYHFLKNRQSVWIKL